MVTTDKFVIDWKIYEFGCFCGHLDKWVVTTVVKLSSQMTN